MRRRDFFKVGLGAASMLLAGGCVRTNTHQTTVRRSGPPNFIIIYTDDQGYGDVGCYGAEYLNTPNWDRMAAEGIRFTDFYSTAPVCTPARASLMTGCYPARVSMDHFPALLNTPVPHDRVLFPPQPFGLHTNEITLARLLQNHGYNTACIGKWHLGHEAPFLPNRHGFDYFFGTPYSNDMQPSVLMRNSQVIEEPFDQDNITVRYTRETINFIDLHRDSPFFIYLSHNMPHLPLHLPEQFRNQSQRGIYGDVIEMLDWSTGQILDHIRTLGLAENTLVVFTSDNGPVRRFGEDRGRVGPLRGGKGNTFEGGMRVPAIFWWPGTIPGGRVLSSLTTIMDLYPTFAHLAGTQPPTHLKIDGKDIRPLLFAQTDVSPYDVFFYYRGGELLGVRSGPWKLNLEMPLQYEFMVADVPSDAVSPESLYNLEDDIGETKNLISHYPEIAETLHRWLNEARKSLGDTRRGLSGAERRPLGVYITDSRAGLQ